MKLLFLAFVSLTAGTATPPSSFTLSLQRNDIFGEDLFTHLQHVQAKYSHHNTLIKRYSELKKRQNNPGNSSSSSNGSNVVGLTLDPITQPGGPTQPIWTANIAVGTPPQLVSLQVDTGSSDLWIATPNSGAPGINTFYDPSKSSTAKTTGRNFLVTYGDTTHATGPIYSDTVQIDKSFRISNQYLGAATQTNATAPGQHGLIGLGFATISDIAQVSGGNTVLENISKTLPKSLFSMQLIDSTSNPGNILFGAIDSTQYQGDLVYANVAKDVTVGGIYTFWQVPLDAFVVNGRAIQVSNTNVVIDSGTVVVYLTTDLALPILQAIGAKESRHYQQVYIFDSPPTKELVEFTIGGTNFGIPVADLVLDKLPDGTYFAGIQPQYGSNGPQILGDVWMRSKYVVYDDGNKRIGFANRVGVNLSASASPYGSPGSASLATKNSISLTSIITAMTIFIYMCVI